MENHFLRTYRNYNFYDAGKYLDTGTYEVAIHPDVTVVTDPVHSIYYVNLDASSINKAIERAKEWVDGLQRCKVCGCTEYNCELCMKKTGRPCSWVKKDLCSACAPKKEEPITQPISHSKNNNEMNFFQQLAAAGGGNVDITMRIMQKGNEFTINIMPGSHKSTNQPYNVTGSAEDLDNEFFTTVFAGVNKIKGINSNLDSVLKQAEKKSGEGKKPAEKSNAKKSSGKKKAAKVDKKKKADKPAASEEEKVPADEPNLFNIPVEEEAAATE